MNFLSTRSTVLNWARTFNLYVTCRLHWLHFSKFIYVTCQRPTKAGLRSSDLVSPTSHVWQATSQLLSVGGWVKSKDVGWVGIFLPFSLILIIFSTGSHVCQITCIFFISFFPFAVIISYREMKWNSYIILVQELNQ